ncbi:hypothetical protein P171DRAFT_395284 [Karstenula rhodostoma CBS 690.94]|uniref:Inner kinetochore subunit AME1 domain-containing protein n=1 Tax=Karstenula rhodostoma CBS 690.94 TaxID=1392251 RepID=A0A9P4PB09_9PLEO|nr:hypothetical protein P171DRAFT_395284 [Karstenula rhodostoma CBS 690.94]
MAPIDRAEREARRQQRKRGAGTSSAITDFNFSFNFAPSAAKHSSVPPQRTQPTPTPKQQTPSTGPKSAKRPRSASVHGSSSVRRHATPKAFATPQLGKRKRGSQDAQTLEDDGEPDELSPDQNNETHSVEQPRRVVGTVSPIREDMDDEPDELTTVLDGVGSLRKHVADTVVRSVLASKTPTHQERTPSARGSATSSVRSRPSARRPKSTEAPPETPTVFPNGRSRQSTSRVPNPATPNVALEEEEDELTPAPASVTPRVVGKQPAVPSVAQHEDEVDELSSPASSETAPTPVAPEEQLRPPPKQQSDQTTVLVPAKRGRPKRTIVDKADEVQLTPAATNYGRKKTSPEAHESANTEDLADELSSEVDRTRKTRAKRRQDEQPVHHQEEPVEISSAEEESGEDQPSEQDEPDVRVLPAPREEPVKRIDTKPTRKRPKFSGPKQAISVMRIKGSTVRGITVADTTRTMLEENIDHQVQRMAAKMQTAEDSSRRKKLRGHINLALAFKEGLVEKLMDLQDANDTLSASFKKRKLLRKNNLERRKEILQIQNHRHETTLEMDDERAVYDAEKAKAEAKSKLNANMFEIQAAIQSGRERARQEGREDEGPETPLSMLIDKVGRQVGSVGGGLLASLYQFNEGLERAAEWLEGRA